MIDLHPEILSKDGKPQFALLPYTEYRLLADTLARSIETSLADPRFGGFWDNISAEELARRQGVAPVENLDALVWPFGPEDWAGFDEAVDEWRHGTRAS